MNGPAKIVVVGDEAFQREVITECLARWSAAHRADLWGRIEAVQRLKHWIMLESGQLLCGARKYINQSWRFTAPRSLNVLS